MKIDKNNLSVMHQMISLQVWKPIKIFKYFTFNLDNSSFISIDELDFATNG